MIKDILVHLDSSSAGEARLAYAIDIALRHKSQLTGMHVIAPVDVPPVFRPSLVEGVALHWQQDALIDADLSEKTFRRVTARHGIAWEWQTVEGPMAEQIARAARSTDLVVIGQYESEGSLERHPLYLAQELVTRCGLPLIVTPARLKTPGNINRALVAWDGSTESVRALHDALPLLAKAKTKVELIVVDSDALAFDSLIAHLRRHSIDVENSIHVRESHTVGRTLIDKLNAGHFDLLVMGAYGHPAWLELLFGGTTSTALTHASTPVLVSH